jgi:hypothetical protein
MKIHDIVEGKSENRKLWDRIKSKGVVPNIDRERYTDMSDQGLEGPFRMKNGQVLYYDPKEGKYYNRDTDMYVDYDEYRAMDESYAAASKKAEASRQRAIKRAAAAYKRHGDMDRAIKDHDLFARDADKIKSIAGDKVEEGANDLRKKSTAALQAFWDKHKDEPGISPVFGQQLRAVAKELARRKKQGVEEGDKRPGYVVNTKDKPKKVKPSKGGESPHPYQGKLVGEADVSNTDYEWTHGRKPSGKGSWFFVAHKGGINFGKHVEGEDYIQLNQMSYSDAKKAAVKWAKSKGHTQLYVAT